MARQASRAFRFSVWIDRVKSRAALQQKARRLEDSGFDVLHLPDHLGAPAPFPMLTAIAAATSTVRLGTYVLNACFYKPALLARDVAAVDLLSDSRLSSVSAPATCRKSSKPPSCRTRAPGNESTTSNMSRST